MSDRSVRVSVRILEKEYQVACLPEERTDLLDSAEYLNGKMREIRDSGNVMGVDRIAVMAALNLANELIKSRKQGGAQADQARERDDSVKQRIVSLREKVDAALVQGQQPDLQ